MKLLLTGLKRTAILAEMKQFPQEYDARDVTMIYEGEIHNAICRLDEVTPEIAKEIVGGQKGDYLCRLLTEIKNQYTVNGSTEGGDPIILHRGRRGGKSTEQVKWMQQVVCRRFDPRITFLFIIYPTK